jgi:molecular chaperone GrpE
MAKTPGDERETADAPAPETAAAHAPEAPPRDVEAELEAARAEAVAASDRALRTLAEFDNYRRRSERDREEFVRRGRADVLRQLLDVADNFDRALSQPADGVPPAFLEGMRLVARGLHDVLEGRGVVRIDAEGRPFDPELHEALAAVPAAGLAPNTVVQVVQAGYRFEDRVLRPATVIVSASADAGTEPAPAAEPAEGA